MPGYGPKHFDLAFWAAMTNKEGSIGDIIEEICKNMNKTNAKEFKKLVWCISVIENRPRGDTCKDKREKFIESYKDKI